MAEPCEGRESHHLGCPCHEARRDAEVERCRATIAELGRSQGARIAEVERQRDEARDEVERLRGLRVRRRDDGRERVMETKVSPYEAARAALETARAALEQSERDHNVDAGLHAQVRFILRHFGRPHSEEEVGSLALRSALAGVVNDLLRERDEARAALAQARREAAEAMRAAGLEACREALCDPADIAVIGRAADAIRAIPIDAPSGHHGDDAGGES